MNEKKSAAYKNLVAEMLTHYPAHGTNFISKLPGTKSIAKDTSKKIVRDFCEKFSNTQDFYNLLEEWGIDWQKTDNQNINLMWAKNSLANAIEDGFDFKTAAEKNSGKVKLWSPVVDKENICQEINLYTYWQGLDYAKKTPKIKYLLVAQDWGNCFGDNSRIREINEGNKNLPYLDPTNSITDNNLIELFKILGYDLNKRHDDLFFTNFCLGYRSGKISSDMTEKMMMQDAEIFKKLCEILEPENILCLGHLTTKCVFKALKNLNLEDAYRGAKNYNEFLDNQPVVVFNYGENDEFLSNVYPLAHCGKMGTLNRSFEKQIKDWENIVKEKKIDAAIEKFCRTNTEEDKNYVLEEIISRAKNGGSFIIAQQNFGGDSIFDEFIPVFKNMKSLFLRNKKDGKYFLAAFTNLFEFARFNESSGRKFAFTYVPAEKLLHDCLRNDNSDEGIILNAAAENNFILTQDMVRSLFQ